MFNQLNLMLLFIFNSFSHSGLQPNIPAPDNRSGPSWLHLLSAISEFFGLSILLFCNILGISGINHHKPYQLIPWLVVYIVGILSSYIGSFLIFSTQDNDGPFKWDGFVPLCLGIVFNLCWTFVKDTFNVMRRNLKNERSVFKTSNYFYFHFNRLQLSSY